MQSLPPRAFVPQSPALSPLERMLVHLALQQYTAKDIADQLHFTPSTISVYLTKVQRKLGAKNRAQLYLRARALGLIEAETSDWLLLANPVELTEALTVTERAVVRNLACGLTTNETASVMNVTRTNIIAHVERIVLKLGASTRVHAVLKAVSLGLV